MSINRIRKFQTIDRLQTFLNGGVEGSKIQGAYGSPGNNAPGVMSLVGLTFITSAPGPAGTCTFGVSSGSNPDPYVLLFSDIASQIKTAISGLSVTMLDGALVIQETTPANGVTISKTGTANSLLGFDIGNDTVGKFYLPIGAASPPVAPYWVWLDTGGDNSWMVATQE
jgi:hypothetical protein